MKKAIFICLFALIGVAQSTWATDNITDAKFIKNIRALKRNHICLAIFSSFLQAGYKIITEHFVFQHWRGFVNHNQ